MKVRTAALTAVLITGALLGGTAGPAAADPPNTYYVSVHTGDLPGADTDATIRVKVAGDTGISPTETLEDENSEFARGSTRTFGPFHWTGLGHLNTVFVTKQNGSEWFPEWIKIRSTSENYEVTCGISEWLRKRTETRVYHCE